MRWASLITGALAASAICCSLLSTAAQAQMTSEPLSLAHSLSMVAYVSPANFAASVLDAGAKKAAIKEFCTQVRTYYRRYHWTDDPCGNVAWRADLRSQQGHPLIYAEFGSSKETTLLLGGVHADELTPMHLVFRFARQLADHPELLGAGAHVIVAPLVNPDGFLRDKPTRTNGNGIDLNRNFFTADWYDKAQKIWQQNRRRSLAHYPGYFPNTEVETIFQIGLIDRYQPDKILSVHAPLGFLDYDGPGSGMLRPLTSTEGKAKRLVKAISESSRNYQVVDYTFYPGSLGNYAGNERHIPTVTLEMQSTDPRQVEAYWHQFSPGLMQAIRYPFTRTPAVQTREEVGNASAFSSAYRG